ncbi:MAG TPA: AraC family transcriptional regulator [Reyranella sp.]|nr:AraC family transcriptional regulator [Reyranella sp.]
MQEINLRGHDSCLSFGVMCPHLGNGSVTPLGKSCYSVRMRDQAPITARTLAAGPDWQAQDFVCRAGPETRAFEEQHGVITIAAVSEGTFQYRSSLGDAVMTPGAVMLGAPGVCFECGHEHGVGDRCMSFSFSPAAWEGIVAAVPGAKQGKLTRPQLPPLEMLAPLFAEAETARDEDDAAAFEEIALRLAGTVVGVLADAPKRARQPSGRDIKRVTAIVRTLASQPEETYTLAALASQAAMSPYHFLRTFRQVVGMAPHQYLLRNRLHRAALRLKCSRDEVSAIAFAAGFNDLSTFNRRFKKVTGVNPVAYRAAGSRR